MKTKSFAEVERRVPVGQGSKGCNLNPLPHLLHRMIGIKVGVIRRRDSIVIQAVFIRPSTAQFKALKPREGFKLYLQRFPLITFSLPFPPLYTKVNR